MAKIIVVGMSRSGTTFLSRSLSRVFDKPLVVEPHLLWKRASFPSFSDDEYVISDCDSEYIKEVIADHAGEDFIEKSPINAFRSLKVFSVFPDAKVIVVYRNEGAVVSSNVVRCKKGDQFSLSIFWEKFVRKKGVGALNGVNEVYIPLKDQIGGRWFSFFLYSFTGMLIKLLGRLPFGPKVGRWWHVTQSSMEDYYRGLCRQFEEECKSYRAIYGQNFYSFNMDDFLLEFPGLVSWVGEEFSDEEMSRVMSEGVKKAR